MLIAAIVCLAVMALLMTRRRPPPQPNYAGAILAVMERVEELAAEQELQRVREAERGRLTLAVAEVVAERAGIWLEIKPVELPDTEKLN